MIVNLDTILEWVGVIFGLLYLVLIIRENIWCWVFGILGSAASVWLFYRTQLYSESILYIYYIAIGFYGWYVWRKRDQTPVKNNEDVLDNHSEKDVIGFTEWPIANHAIAILSCTLLALGLGWVFQTYTEAKNAWLDAFTTIFSFFASFLETRKVVSSWIYWIILNGASIMLYNMRELDIYAVLAVVYFIASFVGLYNWNKKFQSQKTDATF